MGNILEQTYNKNLGVEKMFEHRAVLFIPTESYDAPTITVMRGLQELGFRVYTILRANINSWFVNEVIETPRGLKFDFVLSNLHWGTRWDYYDEFKLHGCLKVLIDGCDNKGGQSWKRKYQMYRQRYRGQCPSPEVLARDLHPYRWEMPLSGYEPDLLFTLQKIPGDKKSHYFPAGIHPRFWQLYEGKAVKDRGVDFTNIPGKKARRRKLQKFLSEKGRLPGRVSNKNVRGEKVVPKEIAILVEADDNVHSYHRWVLWRDYYKLLNDTKVLIYPGKSATTSWWEAACPWEGYGSGCFVLYETPTADIGQYPVTELCKESVYDSYGALVDKCRWLYKDQGRLERLRRETVGGALKYFAPVPLTRYFLSGVVGAM